MGKNFLGLDGLKHFWSKAKSWIAEQITAEVTAKIAEIVANAPEDLDTLKEIADWIKTHANDASAMNTQITTNKNDIATLKTSVAGKADTVHTHTKSQITDFPTSLKNPNALTINGKTYDGSSAVNAGVQTVANGGTGKTTAEAAANLFINSLTTGGTIPEDNDYFISQYVNGGTTTTTYRRRPVSTLWEYIKGKISSVLGLTATNYGGKASTAETADKTVNDITMTIPYVNDSGQYVIPLGNIPELTSTEIKSPYNWDITGFFSIIRPEGHNGSHIKFEAGHGYSHAWITYAYLDKEDFCNVATSIKAFQYNGKWWLGLNILTYNQGYYGKMTITYSRGLPAIPTCILYNSVSDGIANEEIYNSIQDIPSSWWRPRIIHNPTTFTKNITAPNITSLEQRATSLETELGELVSTDKKGRDIVTTYATKDELTKAVPAYSASDAGKILAVNSDGTGTQWVKL